MYYGLGPDALDYVVRNVIATMRQAMSELVAVVPITLQGNDENLWVLFVTARKEGDELFVYILPEAETPPMLRKQLEVVWDAVRHELIKRRLSMFELVGFLADGRYRVRILGEGS